MYRELKLCNKNADYNKTLSCLENKIETDYIKTILENAEPNGMIKSCENSIEHAADEMMDKSFGIIFKAFKYSGVVPLSNKCYTRFELADNMTYVVEFHDQKFYTEHQEITKGFGFYILTLQPGKRVSIFLDVIYNNLLSTDKNKCIDDEDYSFISCTKVRK